MKALVTGGAGFIGSHIAKWLLKDGHQVVVLDDLSGGILENVPEGAKFIQGSITDTSLVASLFEREHFDYVYHLAAYAAEGLSHFIRRFNYTNNVIGSVNLINQSIIHGIKCFVFTSSIAVYGANQLPMREELEPNPEDPYGIAKYAVELDLRSAKHNFDLDYIIFRPHNVYGEGQNIWDKYRNVIGIFMRQILEGKPLTIFGDGEQTRAFTYIDDVAPIITRSVHDPQVFGEVFNVGSDDVYTVNELAKLVCEVMGVEADIVHLRERKEVKHAYSDHSKLGKFFDLPEPVGLREGLERMAAWVKSIGWREMEDYVEKEITFNLPEGW